MSSIDIINVSKNYGGMGVLFGVDVSIKQGEFVVLVGPSGCGKSTLLRMIAGLENISGGEIRIDGEVINDITPQKRDLAMVFQTYALYPHMTVEENILFSLKMRNENQANCKSALEKVSGILGLDELLKRQPKQLSGGQRQRVAMGRAIVRNPRAFLFDEPLSNLDAKLRTHMRTEIRELHQRLEATSIYVTHDQIEAMTMADRIVVMNAGNIEQIGSPLELYDKPVNQFVAGFLGSPTMNFLKGAVQQNDGKSFFVPNGDHKININLPDADSTTTEGPIVLGARPQHIFLSSNSTNSNAINAVVRVVEQTGSETITVVDFLGEEVIMQSPERQLFKPGDHVLLEFSTPELHLFDAESGARLN